MKISNNINVTSSLITQNDVNLEEQKTKGTDDIPENLNEKMYNAILSFKEKYAMFNPNTDKLSQLLMSVKIS